MRGLQIATDRGVIVRLMTTQRHRRIIPATQRPTRDAGTPRATSWASKPKNRALIAKVKAARFHHASDDYGLTYQLTYQSCRFCGVACYRSVDREHGDCSLPRAAGERCRGLWKYSVRHYVCSECRWQILLGLQPALSRAKHVEEF